MFLFYLIFLPSLFVYFVYLFALGNGWLEELRGKKFPGIQILPTYSIIVPYRNEIGNIEQCLRGLMNQQTGYQFEIIAVDDNSEDGGRNIVDKLKKEFPKIQSLYLSNAAGKKAAIHHGIEKSIGEIIITIDADIRVGKFWLNCIGDFNTVHAPSMIVMPVMFEGETDLFQRMQVVEFVGLMGVTGGSIKQKKALMCNGANLAFSKSKYKEVQGYAGNENMASGDDMFLMLKLKEADLTSVMYLQHTNAIGWTKPLSSLSEFLNQRIRWAAKTPHLKDNHIVFAGSLILLINVLLVTQFFFVLTGITMPFVWLICFALKTYADYNLYNSVRPFFHKEEDRLAFGLTSLFLPFYSVFVPIAGLVYKPSWKGRGAVTTKPKSTQRYAKS
jgi:biofilm PGA synthesis N-glycosyltransferase PgaC